MSKDNGNIAKTSGLSVAMLAGFSDELQKIAGAVTVADISKSVKPKVLKPAKLTSKPVVREPEPPTSNLDHLSSTRTIQPPPVTAGG